MRNWREAVSRCQEMAELEKPSINQVYKPSLININFKPSIIPSLNYISKTEFARVAKQLTDWGVTNSGAVIKREGANLVKQAVDITLLNINTAREPKAYFRGVLKKLQNN